MANRFDYFVLFAEMRTGSNFLESNINSFDRFECFGEAFNPHFIGYPNKTEIAGVTRATRDADPLRLIDAIKNRPAGLGGFRYFHDHDPRILDTVLDDTRCAKIILTRNPLDSYVSWKIAQATGQWKLTNVKRRKDSRVRFDGDEFETHLNQTHDFQVRLMNHLQKSGQTAFYLAYEDLQDINVINGLAQFLGSEEQLDALDKGLKKQNPSSLTDKVSNPHDFEKAIARLDRFNLHRTPSFEPRRGPAAPSFVTCKEAPLLYLPVRSGPEGSVLNWMAQLDGGTSEDLQTGLNQKSLRQWKRKNTGHRSFTVLRHPVVRAHHAFCTKILKTGPGTFDGIRKILRNSFKIPLPGKFPSEEYGLAEHRDAFLGFLDFLIANLAGQTAIRVDAHWATQSAVLQGMAQFIIPDHIFRESEMGDELSRLAVQVGWKDAPGLVVQEDDLPFKLADIYDDKIEQRIAQIYQRDYMMFGFDAWKSN
ncbi:sulfotransferase family 2 domain-containing protein [Roseovarius phycicola]|uniref:Sulfotransferase family 2 domain-containing protein n=1 Tax=Roseovarius phycicola TaxID=3080976 RepID=A0ABZ2HKI4_9RHOB